MPQGIWGANGMAEGKKEMTREQKIILASRGYQPALYEVLYDYPYTMIVRNIQTKEPALIRKK